MDKEIIPRKENAPKQAGVEEGNEVHIHAEDDGIVIRPVRRKRYTLDELLKDVTPENRHDEVDTGYSVGREIG
jgi:antitoxin MazE